MDHHSRTSVGGNMASKFRYLFMFGNAKKKVEMEITGSGADSDQLRAKASDLFHVDDFVIQTWDRGFEEWVDIDDNDVVENNSKILITVPSALESSTSSSSVFMDEGAENTECSQSVEAGGESTTCTIQSSPLSTQAGPSSQPQQTTGVPTWHLTYQLPTTSASIEAKLQSGEPLREAERSALLDAVYNSVKLYTFYPKTGQYDTIIQRILDKYPKLLSQQSMSYGNVKLLQEFQRIDGKSSMASLLEDGLHKYTDALVCLAKALKKKPKVLEEAFARVSEQKEAAARKEYGRAAGILAIPPLLQEKVESMLVFEDQVDSTSSPVYILLKDDDCGEEEYSIMVDGNLVATMKSFMSALCVFLAVFYCFNMAYPSCLRRTLNFFQKIILNIQDNLPIDKSVVKILDKLNQIKKKITNTMHQKKPKILSTSVCFYNDETRHFKMCRIQFGNR